MEVKLKNGAVFLIPGDLFKFCRNNFQIQSQNLFNKSWIFGLKDRNLYKKFKFFNKNIMAKLGYQIIGTRQIHSSYYYKIILYKTSPTE